MLRIDDPELQPQHMMPSAARMIEIVPMTPGHELPLPEMAGGGDEDIGESPPAP